MGRDSSVGIATSYGLDVPGIESQWERDFPHSSRPALELTQSIQWIPGLSWDKEAGCGVDHPSKSSVEVKERVELYLFSSSVPSWPVLGRPLPLHMHMKFRYI